MGTVAKYNIDGLHISYDVDGEILSGEKQVLEGIMVNMMETVVIARMVLEVFSWLSPRSS